MVYAYHSHWNYLYQQTFILRGSDMESIVWKVNFSSWQGIEKKHTITSLLIDFSKIKFCKAMDLVVSTARCVDHYNADLAIFPTNTLFKYIWHDFTKMNRWKDICTFLIFVNLLTILYILSLSGYLFPYRIQ